MRRTPTREKLNDTQSDTPTDPSQAKVPCVPAGTTSREPRPSSISKWRALVLVLVHIAIILHLLHWWMDGETLSPLEPSEAMEYSKNSVINAGLVFFVASGLLTLVFGRFFCGWGCHLVAVQDLCYWMLLKVGIRPKAMRARVLLIVPFAAFVYMFLWPPFYRWWAGIGFAEPRLELATADFWATFPPWPIALATLVIAGFAIIYFLGAKGFCTYACPYGALYGALDRFSPGRIWVTEDCKGCGHCTQACTSDVLVHSEVRQFGTIVDAGCMKCLDCVSVCPEDALYFGFGKPAVFVKRRPEAKPGGLSSWWKVVRWSGYSWREELTLAVLFALAFIVYRGLYDSIHFLFSLGVAAIVSYCTMQFLRLFYRSRVKLQQLELKLDGKLTGAGVLFSGAVVLGLGVQVHSATIQHHRRAAEAGYNELYPLVERHFSAPSDLTEAQERLARGSIEDVETLRSLGPYSLFPREAWRLSMFSGLLHLLLGDEEAFQLELEGAIALLPNEPAPFSVLANYHDAAGRLEEAERYHEAATSAAPALASVWLARAAWLNSRGRQPQAMSVLQAGAEQADEPAALWLELAKHTREVGDEPATLSAFEKSIAADPKGQAARYLFGGYLYELGKLEDCVKQYEELLVLTPADTHLQLQATLVCMELEQWDRARKHALAARDLDPEVPEPWKALSMIAKAQGEEAQAKELYERALELAGVDQE